MRSYSSASSNAAGRKEREKMKIRVSIYFEIKDSEIFGGAGTVGYAEQNVGFTVTEEKPQIFKKSAYAYVKKAIANMAKNLGISEECIRTISKEEYEKNTDTDEEEL